MRESGAPRTAAGGFTGAMRGDGLHASHDLYLSKPLAVLVVLDALATARARSRHRSSDTARALLANRRIRTCVVCVPC